MTQRSIIVVVLLLLLLIIIVWLIIGREPEQKMAPISLTNGAGIETAEFQLHESILFTANDLSPRSGYNIQVVSENGVTIVELALSTNAAGQIPQIVLWYDIGVVPCPSATIPAPMTVAHAAYDVSDMTYCGTSYTVRIRQADELVRSYEFRVVDALIRPVLYAADWRGCKQSGFLIGEENIWAVGKNFPKGSIIRLWAVEASSNWRDGDQLIDKTKQYDELPPAIFELRGDETSFIKQLWPKDQTSLGSYDIVAEVINHKTGSYYATASADVQNLISYQTYSGFVIQRRPGTAEPLEVDIAGTRQSPYTFRNTFLTDEDVFVGVDPCLQPSYVGQTADIYIVPDQNDAWWSTSSASVKLSDLDVTGFIETITVGGICGNCWSTLAWSAPLTIGNYDVVLDFNRDDYYTPGVDLIDALDPVGFVVSEVRVNTISFNYSGSGSITVRDNINHANITAPEYYSANHIVKRTAWTMGGTKSVRVEFKAASTVSNLQVWATGGLGGLRSSASPLTISFISGTGTGTFSVNSVPASVGKHLFDWEWHYKNVNGASTPETYMGETGEHIIYTVFSTPQAPMVEPWIDVLEYATDWASGETTQAGVVDGIVNGIYNSGMVYSGYGSYTTGYTIFPLNNIFTLLETPGLTVYFDCRDCANFYHILTNALGLNHQYSVIDRTGGGSFDYKSMLPMGHTTCTTGTWNYHQVGWSGSHVADGSTKLDCPNNILAVGDITWPAYAALLTDDPVTQIQFGICSPQE